MPGKFALYADLAIIDPDNPDFIHKIEGQGRD
jgi:hypothetical protein